MIRELPARQADAAHSGGNPRGILQCSANKRADR